MHFIRGIGSWKNRNYNKMVIFWLTNCDLQREGIDIITKKSADCIKNIEKTQNKCKKCRQNVKKVLKYDICIK